MKNSIATAMQLNVLANCVYFDRGVVLHLDYHHIDDNFPKRSVNFHLNYYPIDRKNTGGRMGYLKNDYHSYWNTLCLSFRQGLSSSHHFPWDSKEKVLSDRDQSYKTK